MNAGASRSRVPGHESVMDDDRDPEAFRALYRAHYRTVCRYLAARTDRDAVEDVAAEAFLVAWRRQAEIPRGHVVPWLLTVAGHCLANHARSRSRGDALAARLAGVMPSFAGLEASIEQVLQRRALVAALVAVGERDRELLLLRFWDGLAPRDVAAVLGLSPVAARARRSRARRRFERELRAALADPPHAPVPEVELT
jgi:RNA polymerase sigma-70 factor (ECF subfamily)